MLPASRPKEVSASGAPQCGGFRAGSYHPESTCPPGTNINDAVLLAARLLDSANQKELLPEGSASLIILLTDGDPTMGEGTASHSGTRCPAGGRGAAGVLPGLPWDPRLGRGAYLRPLWL